MSTQATYTRQNDTMTMPKCLPWTTYTASASYRTDIFSVKRWKNKTNADTWETEIKADTAEWVDEKVQDLLLHIARNVDLLEELLQSRSDIRGEFGLEARPAKPINNVSAHYLQRMLIMHLLDRLYWAYSPEDSNGSQDVIYHTRHPELNCNDVLPKHGSNAVRYLALDDARLKTMLDDFVKLTHTIQPSYIFDASVASIAEETANPSHTGSIIPTPSTSTTLFDPQDSTQNSTAAISHGTSKLKLWSTLTEEERGYLGHATASVSATNSAAVGYQHIGVANLWVLATSLLFVVNIHRTHYVSQFRAAVELIPASVALCHTPLFVLSKGMDLTSLAFPSKDFGLVRVVNATFGTPPALSERTTKNEKAIWRCLGDMLAQIMSPSESTGMQLGYSGQDLVERLSFEMRKISNYPREPAVHTAVPWEHMNDLPPRTNKSVLDTSTDAANPISANQNASLQASSTSPLITTLLPPQNSMHLEVPGPNATPKSLETVSPDVPVKPARIGERESEIFNGPLSPLTDMDEESPVLSPRPACVSPSPQLAEESIMVVMDVAGKSEQNRDATDALRRSMRILEKPNAPPSYSPSLNPSKWNGGKRKSKRKIDQVEEPESVDGKRSRTEMPRWKMHDSSYTLVSHIDLADLEDREQVPIKLSDASEIFAADIAERVVSDEPATETEPQTGKIGSKAKGRVPEVDIEEDIHLIRHVLLDDGMFHKEEKVFKVSWPAGTGDLLANIKVFSSGNC
ncbi:hypothetical protein M422DRAFT_257566 [Sphaerobolus stellatus SS14]|uniref:Uncharacterized protein n=1 Tax=Sphaerobolus stellatus (strain SS14) TaxID=990650 RepID=A0A0C9UXB2_SPHS4|nr:hypothetical protein M422DRAFT_257566 [Sphaerobolus stellatus SS14]